MYKTRKSVNQSPVKEVEPPVLLLENKLQVSMSGCYIYPGVEV